MIARTSWSEVLKSMSCLLGMVGILIVFLVGPILLLTRTTANQPAPTTEYDAERMQVVLDAILKLKEIDRRATNRLENP